MKKIIGLLTSIIIFTTNSSILYATENKIECINIDESNAYILKNMNGNLIYHHFLHMQFLLLVFPLNAKNVKLLRLVK